MLRSEGASAGSRWAALFRRAEPAPNVAVGDDAVRGYARLALDLLARWEELHQHWLTAVDEQRRNERLANAAAVYRWQLNGVRERLEAVTVPQTVATWHGALVEALGAASRGTHLLSHGYRFHNVHTICDGGLLLEAARDQEQAVRNALQGAIGLPVGVA